MRKLVLFLMLICLSFSFVNAKIDNALDFNKKNEENVELHKIFDMMNLEKKYQDEKNYDKEIEICSNLIKEYNSYINKPTFSEFIAMSYFNMAVAYQNKGNLENALLGFNNLINDFKNSNDEIAQKLILLAYIKKIDILKLQNKNKEVIELYYKLIDISKEKKFYKTSVELGFLFEIAYLYSKDLDFDNAIKLYSQIIEKYKSNQDDEVRTVVFASMVNKIEAKILSDKNIEEDVNKYIDYVYDDKQYLMQIDMLHIIKKALDNDQTKEIQKWNDNYKNVKMDEFSFEWLEKWAEQLTNEEAKSRIKIYITLFKNHKIK